MVFSRFMKADSKSSAFSKTNHRVWSGRYGRLGSVNDRFVYFFMSMGLKGFFRNQAGSWRLLYASLCVYIY